MNNIKKIFIGIIIALILFVVSFIAILVIAIVTSPKQNASEVEWSYNIELTVPLGKGEFSNILQNKDKNFYGELNWYDTVEQAIQDDGMFEYTGYKPYVLDEEFFRLQTEDKLIIFHLIPNGSNEKQILLAYIIFACESGKISQPYERNLSVPVPGWGVNNLHYDCDDAVVDYIIFELSSDRVLDDHQLQMFFGSWPDKEELESLTIAGIPLEILDEPLVLNGEEYYFWYLIDLSWCERLQDIQWSSFTYADVIELLDIEYEPREAEQM